MIASPEANVEPAVESNPEKAEPAVEMNPEKVGVEEEFEELEEEEEDLYFSSDSEIGEALDYLDSRDDAEGGVVDSSFTLLNTRRPNAHGGLHSRPNNSSLQPISNKSQKLANRIRAAPLEVYVDDVMDIYLGFR